MNGDFLFAQVTFVGAGVHASHLCEGLDDCLLLQCNDKGQQDGGTCAQALEHLNKVLKLKHKDPPAPAHNRFWVNQLLPTEQPAFPGDSAEWDGVWCVFGGGGALT